MRAGVWWMIAAVAVLGGCASGEGVSVGTATAASRAPVTTLASAVAPSTVPVGTVPPGTAPTVSTIAAPELPPPCDPAALAFDASRSGEGELVVTITNVGDRWCEASLSGSPGIDPSMEPDVWLDPEASAELMVAVDDEVCVAPIAIDALDLAVNGGRVEVSVEPMRVCTVSLIALYPV